MKLQEDEIGTHQYLVPIFFFFNKMILNKSPDGAITYI